MHKRDIRVLLIITLALTFGVGSCAIAADSSRESAASATTGNSVVDSAFAQVYKGDFDGAQKLVETSLKTGDSPAELSELSRVLGEYKDLAAKRETARKAAYQKQMAELQKYRHPVKGVKDANGTKDINDPNDPNGLNGALTVVVRAHELGTDAQKRELLADPFVKELMTKSLSRCGAYEAKGDWLESLISCYSRLMVIYKDDKKYSDYAEELTDKEMVKLSLQDSPCESSKARYEGVTPEILKRTVRTLDLNYVAIINYLEMAQKGINRCQLLGQVVRTVPALQKQYFSALDENKFAAWTNGLEAMNTETANSPLGISKDKFLDIFDKVLTLNDATIKLPREIVIVHFSEAALGALDPHTNLIWPQQVEEFKKNMTNEFGGIGVEISKADGPLKVSSLMPDTPAYTSGLDAEDTIEAVEGTPTKDMPIGCAVKMIMGPPGTPVKLTIRHKGEPKTVDITIKRAKILVPTVRGWQRNSDSSWQWMIDEKERIGYIHVTGFSDKTADDLEKALNALEAQGLRGLIIDLRYNSGGYLETAINLVDKFVEKGLIVSTQPRFGWATYASAHKSGTHPDYPIAVLINGGSASASEIFAGAVQDKTHKRAVIVGTRSYGKGSVQTITSAGEGAQLKYTMAYYHLPSGQRVEGRSEMEKAGRKDWGVGPDVEVELTTEELKRQIETQRDNDVVVKADHKDANEPLKKWTSKQTMDADPQLAIANLVVKSKLIQTKVLAKNNK